MTDPEIVTGQAMAIADAWSPPDAPPSWWLTAATFTAIAREDVLRGLAAEIPPDRLPKFAAPSATGAIDKDANVDPSKACGVKGGGAIRICDYFDRPLVIVAWFTKGCDSCRRQLDTVEQVRRRFPKVAFVGLDIKDSLATVAIVLASYTKV